VAAEDSHCPLVDSGTNPFGSLAANASSGASSEDLGGDRLFGNLSEILVLNAFRHRRSLRSTGLALLVLDDNEMAALPLGDVQLATDAQPLAAKFELVDIRSLVDLIVEAPACIDIVVGNPDLLDFFEVEESFAVGKRVEGHHADEWFVGGLFRVGVRAEGALELLVSHAIAILAGSQAPIRLFIESRADEQLEILIAGNASSLEVIPDDRHRHLIIGRDDDGADHPILRVGAVTPFLSSETKTSSEEDSLKVSPMDRNDAGHPSTAHHRRMPFD